MKKSTSAFFQPWCGANYEQGIQGLRVLILGESHYHDCANDVECREEGSEVNRAARHSELTREVVGWWKDNAHRSPLSHRIPKLFGKKKQEFWGDVVFYNYIQAFAGTSARGRPSDELWTDPHNPRAFQQILDDYKPDRILVLGQKLWANLPSQSPPLASIPEAEGLLLVSNDLASYQEVDRTCYWYFSQSGHPVLSMPVMHPAAVRFSADEWIRPVSDWLSFRK